MKLYERDAIVERMKTRDVEGLEVWIRTGLAAGLTGGRTRVLGNAALDELLDRFHALGSDETGAKPVDVHAPSVAAQPSNKTDSSPSSREARHGVAQALADRVNLGLGRLATRDERMDARLAVASLIVLIDELSDRLYSAAAQLSKEGQ